MIKEVRIPEISENVTSGKVVGVLVAPGDDIEVDAPIIEFETEKAVVEIPSPFKGRIVEILVKEGDELKVGDVIAKIDTAIREEERGAPKAEAPKEARSAVAGKAAEGAAARKSSGEAPVARGKEEENRGASGKREKAPPLPERKEAEAEPLRGRKEGRPTPGTDEKEVGEEERSQKRVPAPASPSVRRFARELGVDIHAVRPAEAGGRITEADVKAHVKMSGAKGDPPDTVTPAAGAGREPELPDFSRWGEIEARELTGVRRLTAEKLAVAWQAVVHVTQFDRADITSVLEFIAHHSERAAGQGGKLTLTAVLMKICAEGLKRFAPFNASIDMSQKQLILKKYVHIGLAVDTPRGLLVPVVRDADRKSILELAVEITDLAGRARDRKIRPEEMEGGTFTISNQGGIGGSHFTPVVFWPQAAILGVGRASTEPVYIDGELRPRQLLPLALSYDHRIADGADAARFLGWIRDSIEHPLTMHFD